jgi:starvation-inducible outer membrane lipoprotein
MMRQLYLLLIAMLMLAACQQPAPTDTVDSLASNLERLKEVERMCKADHAKMGDALCNAAGEARRRRFMGKGKSNPSSTTTTPAPSK